MATASVTNTLVDATTIEVNPLNTNFSDLVSFLNTDVLHRDGSKTLTGNLDADSNKVTNVANGSASGDAVNKSQLDGKADTSHNHAGGDITSGTVGFARLPTGTSGSTVAIGNHTHTTFGNLSTGIIDAQNPSSVPLKGYRSGASASQGLLELYSDIGGTQNVKFQVVGDGDAESDTGVYGTISDESTKENIRDARGYLADLRQVRVRKYTSKRDNGREHIGIVAQELEGVFPGLVKENPQGLKGVKTSLFIPMLLTAVQELADRVDALEDELGRLRST